MTNTLEVEILATLLAVDRVTVRRIAAVHLPWLESDKVFLSNVQAILEMELGSALTQFVQARGEALPRPLLAGTADVLGAALRRFGMAVKVRPCLQLEEHAPGSGESLRRNLTSTRVETLTAFLAGEGVVWRPYDEALDEHARRLRAADLTLLSGTVPVSLDRAPMLALAGPETFRLERIALFLAGQEIAARVCSEVVEPGGTAVELPEIPVAWYPPLRAARGEAELALWVGPNKRLDGLKVRLALSDTSAAPYALFVDLGSTTTKVLRVSLSSNAAQPPAGGWSAELRDRLAEVARMEGGMEAVFMPLPEETPAYLSGRGLPAFDKAALDSGRPGELISWLTAAIRGLAVFVAQEAGTILSHVFWSFPQTADRDFTAINAEVNRLVGHLVLAGIQVVPEHDCLRRRFGTVLRYLATLARQRRKKREAAEAANTATKEHYQSDMADYAKEQTGYDARWISKLWTRPPIRPDEDDYPMLPVPGLEDWYKSYLDLNADPDLEEVLIVDAGGYSLDVFARIGRGDAARVFPKSFRTGGEQMTSHVRAYLAAKWGCQVGDVPRQEAENRKRGACLGESQELSAPCREITAGIYRADPA